MAFKKLPLKKRHELEHTLAWKYLHALEKLAERMLEREHQSKGFYRFIPINNTDVAELLWLAKQHWERKGVHRPNFLDCGCGVGNVLMIASHFGFRANGVEYSEKLCELARILVYDSYIHQGNLLTYTQYNKYHVIYWYCPLERPELEEQFEKRAMNRAKVGALIIPCSSGYMQLERDKRFKQITESPIGYTIWKKTKK